MIGSITYGGSKRFVPRDATGEFVKVAEDLFLKDDHVRFYGFRVRTRMSVIRLADRRLFLYSPTYLDEATRRGLDGLGEVAFAVSPNKIHHLAMGQYAQAYPNAQLVASPGLVERRPDLRFATVLGAEQNPAWAGELEHVLTRGNVFFSEALLFHRASRTLLVGDLVENFNEHTASRLGLAAAAAFGVRLHRPVASPEHRYYTADAEAAERAFATALQWPFERIVPAHGSLIEADAQAVFRDLCDNLLDSARRRGRMARTLFALLARLQ